MQRPMIWLATALLALPGMAQNPCDSLTAEFEWGLGGIPNSISFSANSNFATAYFWSYGDGQFGMGQQGVHTYASAGTYELCLTVLGWVPGVFDTCVYSTCEQVVVGGGGTDPCDVIDAGFVANVQSSTVEFVNDLSNNQYVYLWDFGDGNVGYGADPSHTYAQPGTYYACLLMWSWDQQLQDTCFADHCAWVTIAGQNDPCDSLYACFQWDAQNNVAVFDNCSFSNGQDLEYTWDFGDGTVSDAENPVHTYAGSGTYTVCLMVSLANVPDSCSNTSCSVLTIGNGSPCDSAYVDFTAQEQGGGVMLFVASSQPTVDNYQWFFGDGSVEYGGPTTQHYYALSGTYTVCLVGWYWNSLTQDSCAVEYCYTVVVGGGGSPCDSAVLDFETSSQGGGWMVFQGSANPQAGGYQWIFGDGTSEYGTLLTDHEYSSPGSYYACLAAWYYDENTNDTCWTEFCQWITVPGNGSPCDSANVTFTPQDQGDGFVFFVGGALPPAANYQWFFGDGTSANGGPTASHTYAQSGTYTVCLVGWYWNSLTQDSCAVESCSNVVVSGGSGSPCDAAVLDFEVSSQGGGWMVFQGLANPPAMGYQWLFGDGTSEYGSLNADHEYSSPGNYYACLVAWYYDENTNDTCWTEFCQWITVPGNGSPCDNAVVNFTTQQLGGGVVLFTGAGQPAPGTYQWYFGDNTSGVGAVTQHTYSNPGTYSVCLVGWYWNELEQDSCAVEYCGWVQVGGGSPCDSLYACYQWWVQNNVATFYNCSYGQQDLDYWWSFGDGTVSDAMDPIHTYAGPGTYEVCLTVSYANMPDTCTNTVCYDLVIGGGSPCDNVEACWSYTEMNVAIQFTNCSVPEDNVSYWWDFGDGSVSDEADPIHVYNEPGAYYACLTVLYTDSLDSCYAEQCAWVYVGGASPCDSAELSFAVTVQGGGVMVFVGSATPPADNYQWFFGDGSSEYGGLTTQHYYAQAGTYNVCLVGWYWNTLTQDSCAVEYCYTIIVGGGDPCDELEAEFEFESGPDNSAVFFNTTVNNLVDVWTTWSFGDGGNGSGSPATHQYNGPGYYYVCMYTGGWIAGTQDSCMAVVCDTVYIGPSSVEELGADAGAVVWPQPFDDQLNVAHAKLTGQVRYQLMDVTGRVVMDGTEQVFGRFTLQAGALPPGHYQLRLTSAELDGVVRVLKR